MLVHFHERGRFYERTSEKDAMLRCKFDQKQKSAARKAALG
jgi:hypothetical protein